MSNKTLLERRDKAVPRGVFNVAPLFAEKASGALVTDVDGKEYVDFAAGIGVVNVGHNHPKVVAAVRAQAEKLIHSCFHVVMYEGYVELAEKLAALTPGDFDKKCVLVNSGAEAVENAIKIARHATGRPGIIAFDNAFHGRTLLASTLTSKVMPYKHGFGPFAPEIYRIPYASCYRCAYNLTPDSCACACAEALRDALVQTTDNVGAIIVEPVLGEGGFHVPPKDYFPKLKAICEEFGLVFIADEVQSGFGRTGTMFAMEHWGVEPDLVVTAKGLGGGMPISGVVGRAELMDHPQVGGLGGTYGGNPVSCASALAVLDIFENDGLLDKAQALGERLRLRFEEWAGRFDCIGDARGLGPMRALELVHDRKTKKPAPELAKRMVQLGREKGLLLIACGTHGNVIRVLAPLAIDEAPLERGLSIMEACLQTIADEH